MAKAVTPTLKSAIVPGTARGSIIRSASASWRLLAIFMATIVGSIVRPAPASSIVLFGVCAIALTGTMTPAGALK